MLFNQIDFLYFIIIVFSIFWGLGSQRRKAQNITLLVSSYVFYGWWDWRFLGLIILSSSVDYVIGMKLGNTNNDHKRKLLLYSSLATNLGILVVFKYFNFFSESLTQAFTFMGGKISDPILLSVILPVGISFYTFQTLSYSIDIYRRKIEPTTDPLAFFAFVSFFPQLVAGPIERASNLLPQFCQPRTFQYDEAKDGLRQILWGLFKKVVIADNCAPHVNEIFTNYDSYSGSTLLLGAILFAFQIYGDFSGYSDIAIGVSRLFGFKLMRNFAFPYFSRDIAEFWRKWHISLSTWFRDYVYFPLGGSKKGRLLNTRNILIIFGVSGFWHGANWTFIVWGLLNALYILPLMLLNKNRKNRGMVAEGALLPSPKECIQICVTFLLCVIAWIFFRSVTVGDGFNYLSALFSPSLFSRPELLPMKAIAFILVLILAEWLNRNRQHALEKLENRIPLLIRWSIYYILIYCIIIYGGRSDEFIYFQF